MWPESVNLANLINNYLVPGGLNLIGAVLILIGGTWARRQILQLTLRLLERSRLDAMLVAFLQSLFGTLLLLIIALLSFEQLGVDTTALVALIGAAGLAIGLALKDSLKNFATGFLLILFRPFKPGDYIEAAGISGIVERINIFTTTLKTGDNREIIIPNGNIYNGAITNYSARDTRRIELIIGIGYDADLLTAKQLLVEMLTADERILNDPAPLVAVADLADSSVNLHVRPWVKSSDFFTVSCDLKERIKLSFDQHGITIPYPQMDVHMMPKEGKDAA